jgi:ankyrin repeat protein
MNRFAFALAAVFLLLAGPAWADAALDTALCDAAGKGTPETIASLVQQGANVNAICDSWQAPPLSNAAYYDNIPNMTALLDAGADVNEWSAGDACCQETALGYANSVAAVRLLIAHNANVEARRASDGYTPLIWLSMSVSMADTDEDVANRADIAAVLIDAGAGVNDAGNDGEAPLLMSIGAHSLKFVTLLIDHGADVNAHSPTTNSPLGATLSAEQLSPVMGLDTQDYAAIEALLREHGATQ